MRDGIQRNSRRVKKIMEVRTYLPSKHTPRGQTPVQIGDRFFLLSNGLVCGSAQLESTIVFDTPQKFIESENLHCIGLTDTECRMAAHMRKLFERKVNVFGWRLCDFHWFNPELHSGEDGVPDFKGQRHGQVWSTVRISDAFDNHHIVSDVGIMDQVEAETGCENNINSEMRTESQAA